MLQFHLLSVIFCFSSQTQSQVKNWHNCWQTPHCKDITRLSPLYQTSSLESFHSVIITLHQSLLLSHTRECNAGMIMYFNTHVLKNNCYSTALHFNENASREQAVTKKSDERYDITFPKVVTLWRKFLQIQHMVSNFHNVMKYI